MAAAPGSVVKIAYDWLDEGEPPAVGDFLLSSGGSRYLLLAIRPGRLSGRFHLTCLKLERDMLIPEDARVASLQWYSRRRSA